MALNVTLDGFAYNGSGQLAGDTIYYQTLWYPNGTASSTTKWNIVRSTESSSYWNCNLGDADFLGQEGVALSGGIILVVFWSGATLDRNSLCSGADRLQEWGVLEFTYDGQSVYTNQVQVKPNVSPILNWTFPSSGFVGTSYTANNNSYDNHSWDFNGVTMQHLRRKYGEDIQLINSIYDSSYDWADGTTDSDLPGAVNATHIWATAGSYDVELVISDECLTTVTGTKTINIRNRAPVPDINCLEVVGTNVATPNTVVSFEYSGTDPNNQITSIDWIINDTGTYGNTSTIVNDISRDAVVPHSSGIGTGWCGQTATSGAFTNPDTHTVQIVIHWFDGFDNLTINYSKDFTQGYFSGPTVDFIQDPTQATTSGTVSFTNTSTDFDRVGTGPPDCARYDWTFTDGSYLEEALNVDRDYVFSVTPLSVAAEIKLCANWNDGWENHETCETKSVVFATQVIATPEDCYYNLDIIGTSSDGTISGYSWEIYSDTTISGGVGPWELIWESPVGLDQKMKQVGFTEVGYYKVVGYIYGGGTTSDDETILITEVCPTGSITHVIWDGTGPLDNGDDWVRSGFGFEAPNAAHAGTNGLNAWGMQAPDYIHFVKTLSTVDINDYESLTFWINLHHMAVNAELNAKLHMSGGQQGTTLKLSNYINISKVDEWQKVYVPLSSFGLKPSNLPGHPTYVNTLRLDATGDMSFYIDDIILTAGALEKVAVSICSVDMDSDEIGVTTIKGAEMTPNMKGTESNPYSSRIDITPYPKPKIR